MYRFYTESPEFHEFSKFDTGKGRLEKLSRNEFENILPEGMKIENLPTEGVHKFDIREGTIFAGEIPERHTRFPRRIYFQITRNCNLGCPYCYIEAGPGKGDVPTKVAINVAQHTGRKGLMEVRLTGGEPTTHPDFFPILDAFRENDVYVSVATNGLVNKKTLDGLAERKNLWVICSVDGNRETHNVYRPGSFDKILRNMRYLKDKEPEVRLRLTTTLTKQNMGQMYELGEICKYLDAESITVIPLRPKVRKEYMKDEMVTAPEFRNVIEDLIEVQDKLGVKFTTTIETKYAKKIYRDPVFTKKFSCAAGREGTNLDYDKKRGVFVLYGCSYSPATDFEAEPEIRRPFVGGEFGVDDIDKFMEIWRDDSLWAIYRDDSFKHPECIKDCEYYAKHQCVGSCPIQNVNYDKINASSDVLGQLKAQLNKNAEWYCYKNILG